MGGKIFKFEKYKNKSESGRPVWISSEDKENGHVNEKIDDRKTASVVDTNPVLKQNIVKSDVKNEPDSIDSIPELAVLTSEVPQKVEKLKEPEVEKPPQPPPAPVKVEVQKTTVPPGHVINPKFNKPIPVDFGPEQVPGRILVLLDNSGVEGTRVVRLDPTQEIYDKQVLMKFEVKGDPPMQKQLWVSLEDLPDNFRNRATPNVAQKWSKWMNSVKDLKAMRYSFLVLVQFERIEEPEWLTEFEFGQLWKRRIPSEVPHTKARGFFIDYIKRHKEVRFNTSYIWSQLGCRARKIE